MLLGGEAPTLFARSQGLEQVDPSYFFTEERWRGLERGLAKLGLPLPPRPFGAREADEGRAALVHEEGKHGTVGVVALTARATSRRALTSGTTAKRWGRVGDSR